MPQNEYIERFTKQYVYPDPASRISHLAPRIAFLSTNPASRFALCASHLSTKNT